VLPELKVDKPDNQGKETELPSSGGSISTLGHCVWTLKKRGPDCPYSYGEYMFFEKRGSISYIQVLEGTHFLLIEGVPTDSKVHRIFGRQIAFGLFVI